MWSAKKNIQNTGNGDVIVVTCITVGCWAWRCTASSTSAISSYGLYCVHCVCQQFFYIVSNIFKLNIAATHIMASILWQQCEVSDDWGCSTHYGHCIVATMWIFRWLGLDDEHWCEVQNWCCTPQYSMNAHVDCWIVGQQSCAHQCIKLMHRQWTVELAHKGCAHARNIARAVVRVRWRFQKCSDESAMTIV